MDATNKVNVDDNHRVMQAAEQVLGEVLEKLSKELPVMPVDIETPQELVKTISTFAQSLQEAAWAQTQIKKMEYLNSRQHRATKRKLQGPQKGNPALVGQEEMLYDLSQQLQEIRFMAKDRCERLENLLKALYEIRKAVVGGF